MKGQSATDKFDATPGTVYQGIQKGVVHGARVNDDGTVTLLCASEHGHPSDAMKTVERAHKAVFDQYTPHKWATDDSMLTEAPKAARAPRAVAAAPAQPAPAEPKVRKTRKAKAQEPTEPEGVVQEAEAVAQAAEGALLFE